MVNSRNIFDLDPAVRDVCNKQIALCRSAGIEIIITSTWRDFEAQAALYAIGRTTNKDRHTVTKARAGYSWHNFKAAWDVVPVIGGKPLWDSKHSIWREVVAFGKQAGAEAGADWKSFPDLPHFQFIPTKDGKKITLAQARDLFAASGTVFSV